MQYDWASIWHQKHVFNFSVKREVVIFHRTQEKCTLNLNAVEISIGNKHVFCTVVYISPQILILVSKHVLVHRFNKRKLIQKNTSLFFKGTAKSAITLHACIFYSDSSHVCVCINSKLRIWLEWACWDLSDITYQNLHFIMSTWFFWGVSTLDNPRFFSDNMAVVEIINKQSSKDKTIMRLVIRLVIAALTRNIFFKANHIRGDHNCIADHLSRFKFQEARTLAPWLDHQPTMLPHHLIYI